MRRPRSQAYAGWDLLSARAFDARVARQRRAYDQAVACCLTSRWAAESVIRDYGISPEKVHVVGVGPQPRRRGGEARLGGRRASCSSGWTGSARTAPGCCVPSPACGASCRAPGSTSWGAIPRSSNPASSDTECSSADVDGRNERLEQLFAQATCFVLPSHSEASAIAYVEAAAAGLPSIGTVAGGSDYLIGDGGLVVDPGDDDALLDAMLWLADPAVAARKGAAARRRSERFTWEAVGRRLLRALDGAPPEQCDAVEDCPHRCAAGRAGCGPPGASAAPRSRREHGAQRRHVSSARGRPGQRRRRVRGLAERHAERLHAGGRRPRGACARRARGCARRSPGSHPAPRTRRPRGGPPPPARSGPCGPRPGGAGTGRCPRSRGRSPRRTRRSPRRRRGGRACRRRRPSRAWPAAHTRPGRGSARRSTPPAAAGDGGRAPARTSSAAAGSGAGSTPARRPPRASAGPTSAAAGCASRAARSAPTAAASMRASGLRKRRNGASPRAAPRLQPYEKPPLRGERTIATGRPATASSEASGEALSTTVTLHAGHRRQRLHAAAQRRPRCGSSLRPRRCRPCRASPSETSSGAASRG